MLNIKPFSNILIVVAHPDDEFWGLGGTLLRLRKEFKCYISIVMVSDGERGDGTGEKRMRLSKELANAHGVSFDTIGIPANQLEPSKPEIIAYLDKLAIPPIVFTHFEGDIHQDHKAVLECVLSTLRNYKGTSIFQIETPFKHGFLPNFYINISGYSWTKSEQYVKYFYDEIELREEYECEYFENINKVWGREIGVKKAEAFILKKGGII